MKSYGARSLQKTDTINLALNVGSEKIDRDQPKLIKGFKVQIIVIKTTARTDQST